MEGVPGGREYSKIYVLYDSRNISPLSPSSSLFLSASLLFFLFLLCYFLCMLFHLSGRV